MSVFMSLRSIIICILCIIMMFARLEIWNDYPGQKSGVAMSKRPASAEKRFLSFIHARLVVAPPTIGNDRDDSFPIQANGITNYYCFACILDQIYRRANANRYLPASAFFLLTIYQIIIVFVSNR